MRVPIRHLAGNVMWTPQGGAWAVWRVEGPGLALVSADARRRYLAVVEGLYKQLRGEALLLSLCPLLDPAGIAERMVRDVDLDASPRYVALVDRVLDQLSGLELSGRTDWLAVPLPTTPWQALRDAAGAARAEVTSWLGLLPAPVPAAEEERCLEAAVALQAGWPPDFRVRPAHEAEILWMIGHSLRRGVLEPLLPGAPVEVRGRGRGAAALGQAVLREGGAPEDGQGGAVRGQAGRALLPRRRWLEVSTEHGTSYQALLALAQMPAEFTFPGSEYLQALDQHDFPVDWAVRLNVVPQEKARRQARRQASELANQYGEYDGVPSGPPSELESAEADMDEYQTRMGASRTEVEVQAMVAMCVWGSSPRQAEENARALVTQFGTAEYQLVRPVGEQEALWYGMLPGTRTPRVMSQYRQYLTARDMAMAGAATGTELGDPTGGLLGLQTTSGGVRPVLTDWAWATARNRSASAAFVGELGAGKTVAMMTAVYQVLAGGRRLGTAGSRGRAVIVDRTPRKEWVNFVEACPGSTQVIVIDQDAQVSLDPLRAFADRKVAQRRTESFLSLLLGVAGASEEGTVLSEAAEVVLAGARPSMPKLLARLETAGATDTAARSVARRLAAVERKDLARRLLFDESLPVVEMGDADAIVFAVSEVELPTAEELAQGPAQLEFEKLLGRAVMYLVAAMCRQLCFADRREFAAAVWDECWWLTSSPEGMRLLLELVRDGRKHKAGVFVGSHDSEDIGPSGSELGKVLLGLIPRRFLFRHTSQELARRGLVFLGLEPTKELVRVVTDELSPEGLSAAEAEVRAGECLHRDLAGRIGAMQIAMPLDEQVVPHMYSDPDAQQADADSEAA